MGAKRGRGKGKKNGNVFRRHETAVAVRDVGFTHQKALAQPTLTRAKNIDTTITTQATDRNLNKRNTAPTKNKCHKAQHPTHTHKQTLQDPRKISAKPQPPATHHQYTKPEADRPERIERLELLKVKPSPNY